MLDLNLYAAHGPVAIPRGLMVGARNGLYRRATRCTAGVADAHEPALARATLPVPIPRVRRRTNDGPFAPHQFLAAERRARSHPTLTYRPVQESSRAALSGALGLQWSTQSYRERPERATIEDPQTAHLRSRFAVRGLTMIAPAALPDAAREQLPNEFARRLLFPIKNDRHR